MAYVDMTRGRDENHLAIYPAVSNEADHHRRGAHTGIHQMHRGTTHAAAQGLQMIVANDDRAATMHTVAARTDPELCPPWLLAYYSAMISAASPRPGLARAQRPRPRPRPQP